ncbi:ExbD/TolR family protein [Elongatibacter sediminis]|uniref:Biopolymer transporter ExbD n=1 Tax=Elongatibacter sediminis TaxID=3119006 RepID=A0AAW9RHF5_9GAMM
MKLRSQSLEEPTIDLTSLIDVVFLLLIFFMVSTTFERQAALKIDLPEASEVEAPRDLPERLELVIDATGRMYLNERQLIDSSDATLAAAFSEAVGENRDLPLILRADRETPHHYVVTAMDVAARLGFTNLSIAADRSSGTD